MTMAGKFSGDIKTRALRISDSVKSSPYYMKITLMTELGQLFRTTLWMTLSRSAICSTRAKRDKGLKTFQLLCIWMRIHVFVVLHTVQMYEQLIKQLLPLKSWKNWKHSTDYRQKIHMFLYCNSIIEKTGTPSPPDYLHRPEGNMATMSAFTHYTSTYHKIRRFNKQSKHAMTVHILVSQLLGGLIYQFLKNSQMMKLA